MSAATATVIPFPTNDPVTSGQEAWERIKSRAKMDRQDWRMVGEVLLIGRKANVSDKLFGKWCRDKGFDMSRDTRADAMWLAENWSTVESLDSSEFSHPKNIRAVYREALAKQAQDDSQNDSRDEDTKTKPNTPTVTATTPASASVTQAEKDVAAEEAERVYQATLLTDEDEEMLRKKANPTLPIIAQIGALMDLKITNNNHFFTDRFLEDINKDYFLNKAKGVFLNEISSGKSLDSAITSAKKAIRIAEIDSLERIKQALFKVSNDAMTDLLRHAKSDPLLDITNARIQKLLTRALDKSSSDTERLAALNALQKMKTP